MEPFSPPKHLPAAFSMSPVVPDDIPAMVEVHNAAFSTDPANTFWWPPDRDLMTAWLNERFLMKLGEPNVRHHKLTDRQTGELVAWMRWELPESEEAFRRELDEAAAEEASAEKAERKAREMVEGINLPEGSNKRAFEDFLVKMNAVHARHKKERMTTLLLICTAPKHERRGAASALIGVVIDAARREGVPVWLEGTTRGKPLYERLGFETVEELEFDIVTEGKVGGRSSVCCMRLEPTGSGLEL